VLKPRTKVFITIDTECTEERLVRGKVRPPLGYAEMMWGRVGTQQDLGISMLVAELRKHGMAATFFVEALCTLRFGEDGLAEAIRFLVQNGQDVQLHLHPNFERPEWRTLGAPPPEDDIGRLPGDEQRRLLVLGSEILLRCGVGPGELTAFRAGNYAASSDTRRILYELGFSVDASYNPYVGDVDHRITKESVPNDAFLDSSGIWELPVSNVMQPRGGLRHLQITALSWAEMRWSLMALHSAGVRHISVVTHPGEFFVVDSISPARGRANSANIRRLRSLLAFLADNQDSFDVSTVGTFAKHLPLARPSVETGGPYPTIGVHLWLGRQLEQAAKRVATRVRG
jgi:hypothetical protein